MHTATRIARAGRWAHRRLAAWTAAVVTGALALSVVPAGPAAAAATDAGITIPALPRLVAAVHDLVVAAAPENATGPGMAIAVRGQPYPYHLVFVHGPPPHTFRLAYGHSLPPGLSLTSDGRFTGVVEKSAPAVVRFIVDVTDKDGRLWTITYEINVVDPPPLELSPKELPGAKPREAYYEELGTTGGTGPYTYTSSTVGITPTGDQQLGIPPGLRLTSEGQFVGRVAADAGGSYIFDVTSTDKDKFTGKQRYTIAVRPDITLGPDRLPAARLAEPYDQALTATGGKGPYTYRVTDGGLPDGLELTPVGRITGTADASDAQTGQFTVTVTDANKQTGTRQYELSAAPPEIRIGPKTLPGSTAGEPYSQQLTADGGTAPYRFEVTEGQLPPGLELDRAGALTGTPAGVGRYTFTVEATDRKVFTSTTQYTVDITGYELHLEPKTLPPGTVYTTYTQKLATPNGAAPVQFALAGGALPPGTTLAADGTLSGVPTHAGTYTIEVEATDATGSTGRQSYTIVVAPPAITIGPKTLAGGKLYQPYKQKLAATGGAAPVQFALAKGAPPAGTRLDADGTLSGVPAKAGTYTFTVQAKDKNGHTSQQSYTIAVAAPTIVLSPSALPGGKRLVKYPTTVIKASGGAAPYTYKVTYGQLPPGIAMTAHGTVYGKPAHSGTHTFTVTATDKNGYTGHRTYKIIASS